MTQTYPRITNTDGTDCTETPADNGARKEGWCQTDQLTTHPEMLLRWRIQGLRNLLLEKEGFSALLAAALVFVSNLQILETAHPKYKEAHRR